jgi:hypothetical protein
VYQLIFINVIVDITTDIGMLRLDVLVCVFSFDYGSVMASPSRIRAAESR